MGLMDRFQQLMQPYDEESRDGDFFEGADEGLRGGAQPSAAQMQFESAFGGGPAEAPEPAAKKQPKEAGDGGLLGSLGLRRQPAQNKPKSPFRERTVNAGGTETNVILFNPKNFDEAGALAGHIQAGRCAVMSLENVSQDNARRLMDFMSGIAFALQWKITPISAKAFFVSPREMDLFSGQDEQPETDGQYL